MTTEICKTVLNSLKQLEESIYNTRVSLEKMLEETQAQKDFMCNPTGLGVRMDRMGSGLFGAGRVDERGVSYKHKGLDLFCDPGQGIVSPIDGTVVRKGRVYVGTGRWELVVVANDQYEVKVFYVNSLESVIGKEVVSGQIIATADDITEKNDYRERGMMPHVHIEIRKKDNLLDPFQLIRI